MDPAAEKCAAVTDAAFFGHEEVVAFLCRLGPADGFPCDAKNMLLRCAAERQDVSVIHSLCILPASVGVSCTNLRELFPQFPDLCEVTPGTVGAMCQALCWQTLLWRRRRLLLTLCVLRERGHATAKGPAL